jgi:hypothetical protein
MSPHDLLRLKALMDFGQNKGGAFEDSRTLTELDRAGKYQIAMIGLRAGSCFLPKRYFPLTGCTSFHSPERIN